MSPSKKTVFELLTSYVQKKPDFLFLQNEDECYTSSEFFFTVLGVGNSLTLNGVKKGDIVAILCKRDIETILYFFACQIIGAVALMVDEYENVDTIEERYGIHICYSVLDNRSVIKYKSYPRLQFVPLEDSKETTIGIFTSGSTGERKIVKLSQYGFINNAYDSTEYGGYIEEDLALAFLPMNHVFAIAMLFTSIYFYFGVFVALAMDISYLLKCIEKYHITRFNAVPTLLLKMVELKGNYNVSSLRCAYIGGAPSSERDYLKIESELGIKLIPVYGMTECIGISTGGYTQDSKMLANSVGVSYSMNDIKIAEDGEILVKGPAMCNGYYSGELSTLDGYLQTGDLGEFDANGFLHIIGRKKEIIIRNGNNISIAAITKKIQDLKIFKNFVVVGIENKNLGEVPALAIVDENNMSMLTIMVELSKVLNKLEMPEKIVALESIPLLENGKIDKQRIKKIFI